MSQRVTEFEHGTLNGYNNRRCRCDACREAGRKANIRYIARKRAEGIPDDKHGTTVGYAMYACRCDACREAHGRHTNIRLGSSREYVSHRESRQRMAARESEKAKRNANRGETYRTGHNRIQTARGKAREYKCEFCGEQARHWALKADAAHAREEHRPNGAVLAWSTEPSEYRPLCAQCHVDYDWHARNFGACVEAGCHRPEHAKPVPFRKRAKIG